MENRLNLKLKKMGSCFIDFSGWFVPNTCATKKERKQIQNFSGHGNVDKSQVDTQVKKCSRVKYEQTSV